jgi:hypothetical protein
VQRKFLRLRTIYITAIVLALTGLVPSAVAQNLAPVQVHQAIPSQQKLCDEQASKRFHEDHEAENGTGSNWINEHTSHFDVNANVCYMILYRFATLASVGPSEPGLLTNEVYDSFKGTKYASYQWHASPGSVYSEAPPTDCHVKPRGQEAITCGSFAEFKDLIEKYFGIGR